MPMRSLTELMFQLVTVSFTRGFRAKEVPETGSGLKEKQAS